MQKTSLKTQVAHILVSNNVWAYGYDVNAAVDTSDVEYWKSHAHHTSLPK